MIDKVKSNLKGALKSSTIWFNTAGLTLLTIAVTMPELKTFLFEHNMDLIWIVGNMALRAKTTEALAEK